MHCLYCLRHVITREKNTAGQSVGQSINQLRLLLLLLLLMRRLMSTIHYRAKVFSQCDVCPE